MSIRSALRSIAYELGKAGSYTNDNVVAELRLRFPKLVASESQKLENIALKKILSDVDAKQLKVVNPDQREFFPELAGFPGSYDARVLGLTEEKGARILIHLLPISTVRAIASYERPRKKNSSLQSRLKTYLEEISPHIQSDDETFGTVIQRSRN